MPAIAYETVINQVRYEVRPEPAANGVGTRYWVTCETAESFKVYQVTERGDMYWAYADREGYVRTKDWKAVVNAIMRAYLAAAITTATDTPFFATPANECISRAPAPQEPAPGNGQALR
jgi:hypothetical protein